LCHIPGIAVPAGFCVATRAFRDFVNTSKHIKGVRPGEHRRDFLAGKEEAELAAGRLLERLRKTSGGFFKARRMQRLIKVHRSLIGIREHPKYFIVQNLDMFKQAVLEEAAKLVAAGILKHPEEVF
jgi:pyruvate,water dikinase